MSGQLDDRKRWLVPLSLAVSFLANDGEELATLVPTLPDTLARLPLDKPLPKWVYEVDQVHINTGITMMGALCTASVVDGVRTRGRGALYQDFQWAFGMHGLGHIAAALVTKGYSTGIATSPTVVLPQFGFSLRELRAAGVPHEPHLLRVVARVGGWLLISHLIGAVVSRVVRARA